MTNKEKHIPSGYKPSPLGPIPEDWEVKRLGEIGEVLMCKRIMKNQTDSCGDIPFFKIGTFGGKPDAYISKEVFDEYKTKYSYPKIGDVLISAAGTIGRSVIFDGTPSYYQDSNIVWIDNDNKQLLNKYLYYYYSTINWITDTGTIPRLYNGALKAIQIPTPPIEQQKLIVSILELWDTAIAKQTALIEKLSLRKRGLMQQLLTGKKRLNGFDGEWKEVRLGEVCEITTGKLDANAMVNNGTYPFYTCAKETYRINEYAFDTEALLVSGNGEHVGYVHYYKGKFNAYQRTYVLDKFLENIFYLYYALNQYLPKRILQTKSNSNTPYIVMETLANMGLLLPENNEQKAIAEILMAADKEIEIQKQKLSSLQSQKRGLMQQLLTGKKRIK